MVSKGLQYIKKYTIHLWYSNFVERDGKRCDWWGEVLNKRAMIKKKKRFENTLIVKYTYVRQQEIMTMQ